MNYRRILLFIQVFSLLVFLVPFGSFAQSAQVIPFKLIQNSYILIQAKVAGCESEKVFLDTGAGIHVFSKNFFDKLSARPDGYYTAFRHNGERLDLELFEIPSIQIGSLVQKNPHISFWTKLDSLGIDGILSAKLFEYQPVTFDFENQQLTIETSETVNDRKKYGYTIAIRVRQDRGKSLDFFSEFLLNDQIKVELEIDTGAGNSIVLHSRYMKSLNIDPVSEKVEKKEIVDMNGNKVTIYLTSISKISFLAAPNINISEPLITFKDNIIYDGLMGNVIWQGKKVTLDIPHRQMIINIPNNNSSTSGKNKKD